MKNTQKDKKYTLIVKYKAGFLEISGDTYPVKEKLKAIGLRWDPSKKVWYAYTKSNDNDYVDEYIEELSKIANIKFAEDSSIKSINKNKNKEESVMAKEEQKSAKEEKTEDELDKLFSCRANLSFITIKNPSDEIAQVKKWNKVESKYFEVYQYITNETYHAVFDNVKNVVYLIRDDNHDFDEIFDPKIIRFLKELDRENLSKEEASKKLEDFIQKNYILISTAKEMFSKLKERKEKIEKEISVIPRNERVKQLKDLLNSLNNREAYLLPEFEASKQDIYKDNIVEKVVQECKTEYYNAVTLSKCDNRYVLAVHVLNDNRSLLEHTIYILRDDNGKVEEFLKSLENTPLSLIPGEIEKYLKENFNYKEFSYVIKPYITIEILYNEEYIMDGGRERIDAVLVDGYTDLIYTELKELGFWRDRDLGDKAWVKYLKTKSPKEAEDVVKKLVEKIKDKVEIRFAGGSTQFARFLNH